MSEIIKCVDLIKVYEDPINEIRVPALRGLDISIDNGALVSIIGPSGAGKTTLVRMLSGAEIPTSGTVIVKDQRLDVLEEEQRRSFRYYNIGLVNQFVSQNLFAELSVTENLMLPKRMFLLPREQSIQEVGELLELLNLSHIKDNKVGKISGGEAMRLSLGVALAKNPEIILADEPTGQLDTQNTMDMIDTIRNVNLNMGKTILVVTHDIRFRNIFKNSYIIRDGRLVGFSKDLQRHELEFLMESSDVKTSYIDASNFVRIPDKIKLELGLKDQVEFEIHPTKKLGLFWNPARVTRENIFQLLKNEEKIDEEEVETDIDAIEFQDIEHLISREFIPPTHKEVIIGCSNLNKTFKSTGGKNIVLDGVNLEITKGDFVFVSGPSGVGKTTLFNLISGLDKPTEGRIIVNGFPISEKNEQEVSMYRLNNIAYITQHNNLFDPITVKENIRLPYLFTGKERKYDEQYGMKIVKECQIKHKLDVFPYELSAGEKQRASLAVALARKTDIILADEPTANVDSELARHLMNLLMDISRINKTTIMVCSHDLSLLRPGFRHIELEGGGIYGDTRINKNRLKDILIEYLQIKSSKK